MIRNAAVVELAERVLQEERMLPDQWFRRSSDATPEKRLCLAVLEDAISDLEAKPWFFSDDNTYLFSFVNICEVLGFNPDYFRRGLFKLRGRRVPRIRRVEPTRIREIK